MANVKGGISDDLHDYVPNVCTSSPAHNQAFCKEHCAIVKHMGYPTELREFLKSCARDGEEGINPDNYTKGMQEKVDAVLHRICKNIPASSRFQTSVDAQGTGYLLRDRNLLTRANVELTGDGDDCNK